MKMSYTAPPLFFFFLSLFDEQIKETQIITDNHIVVWHLSAWEEIIGELREIFISGSLCRILFLDGINIYVSHPDKKILQRLQSSRGKIIGIIRTDAPARRYLFNFYDKHTSNKCSTSIHLKNDEEISALKILNGSQLNHGNKTKPWSNSHPYQEQLSTWIEGK
jgi:hypothetical protein